MMHDEGPSEDDLRRFGEDTGHCPDCGAEIWDDAEICPECRAYISGSVSGREPIERGCRRQWIVLIVIILLIAFALTYIF